MARAHRFIATLVFAVFATATLGVAQDRPSRGPEAPFDLALATQVPKEFSPDCRVRLQAFDGKRPFKACRKALRERRTIKVLAVGSSSTSGIGASSPGATYPVRLESDLETFLKGIDVDVVARGVPGEIGAGAADRMRLAVADLKPDLVVWQVGTNDALARIGVDDFRDTLRDTVRWLVKNKIDVVLIDPQYVERLATDENYRKIVKTISEVAGEERVIVVHRYDAMSDLAKQRGNANFLWKDGFHLNDLGYRCMAEYAARAIVSGILEADREANAPQPVRTGVQN